MLNELIQISEKFPPMCILEVEYKDEVFTLHGFNWTFVTTGYWRLCSIEKMIIGCYDNEIEPYLICLKGLNIVEIIHQTSIIKMDPVFILSNKQWIEIFSTTAAPSWTFERLPDA